jgi:hypothetical protein
MRTLAEQTMQQQQQHPVSVAPSSTATVSSTSIFNTSPSGLPTLGNQPNSPTAKKAKRRLGPAGSATQLTAQRKLLIQTPTSTSGPEGSPPQVETQRRHDAQQDVAKQMKEAAEYALQQSQLRQLQAQIMHQQAQMQHHHQQQQQQQQQQQAQMQQQQKLVSQPVEPRKPTPSQPALPQKPAQQMAPAEFQQQVLKIQELKQQQQQKMAAQKQASVQRQPLMGKQPTSTPVLNQQQQQQQQQMKVSSNGVAGQHFNVNHNHGKLANGDVSKLASHPPALSVAAASPHWPPPAQNKAVPQGTNGLATAHLHQRLREIPTNQQEAMDSNARNAKGKNKKKKKASQDLKAVGKAILCLKGYLLFSMCTYLFFLDRIGSCKTFW